MTSSPEVGKTGIQKQEHLIRLKDELNRLQYNLSEFNSLIDETSTQFKSMQRLAVMHGSLFMASNTVFGNDNFAENED